jgi:hypothetical protein
MDLGGVILSGGPASVYAPDAPKIDKAVLELGVPVLGICYGMQWMCQALGGEVLGSRPHEADARSNHRRASRTDGHRGLEAEPSFDISGLEDRIVSIEKASFGFFLALIADADVFVGVDSVGFHAADFWRVPAVGLFGPTRPEEWGGRFSPLFSHVYGAGRMDDISVDAVLDAT